MATTPKDTLGMSAGEQLSEMLRTARNDALEEAAQRCVERRSDVRAIFAKVRPGSKKDIWVQFLLRECLEHAARIRALKEK